MSDYISRLIRRSFAMQPAIRRRFPALFEPPAAESIPSLEFHSSQWTNTADPVETGSKASATSRNYVQSYLQNDEDRSQHYEASAVLPLDDPVPSVVILDKNGRLFTEKPFPSHPSLKENGLNASVESASDQPAARRESEVLQKRGGMESSDILQSSGSRASAIPGPLLEESDRLARIRASISARLITKEFQDFERTDFPPSCERDSVPPSEIRPRETIPPTDSAADEMPEATESNHLGTRRGRERPDHIPDWNPGMEIAGRRARQISTSAEAGSRSSDSSPSIEIRIDRVEVRAVVTQALPQNSREVPKQKQSLSLDEYLEQRKGGKR